MGNHPGLPGAGRLLEGEILTATMDGLNTDQGVPQNVQETEKATPPSETPHGVPRGRLYNGRQRVKIP